MMGSPQIKISAIALHRCRNLDTFVPVKKYVKGMSVNNIIVDYAKANKEFRTRDLLSRFAGETGISEKTLSWTLHRLVSERKLYRIGRGRYTTEPKQVFSPRPNAKAVRLYKRLKAEFPLLSFCVYNGEILAELQHHLSYNNNIYVETERDAAEAVFHYLQDSGERTFLTPKEEWISTYIHLDKKSVIVKALVSESPLQEVQGVKMPGIEKLLVDIQCDKDFFYLQGQESIYIMDHAFDSYAIHIDRLLRYAGRRNIKSKIEDYIKQRNR